MARLRYNGLQTTLGGTGLDAATTAVTFAAALTHSGGTPVPTITGTDYIPLAILNTTGALTEIVYLTAYTSGALTGTITRAQESTTAATHAAGATVENGPTVADFTASSSGGTIGFTQLSKSANQSLPSGAWTAVTWDTEDYDTYNLHSNATNPSRLTAPTTGIWLFHFHVAIGSTGTRYLSLYKNGVQLPGWTTSYQDSVQAMVLTHELALTAGDYIEAFVYQNSGATGNILGPLAAQVSGSIVTARLVGTVA